MYVGVEIKVGGIAALKRSEVNSILKEAFFLTGKRWRQLYLPLHFGDRAQRRYGYARRSGQRFNSKPVKGSYSARKLAAVKHERPLELSGKSKMEALTRENISATRKEVKIRLPRGFNRRPAGGKIRMNDEIRATRPDEIRDLSRFLAGHIRKTLRQSGAKKATVTIQQVQ